MKNTNLITILLLLLLPAGLHADERMLPVGINECIVGSVEFSGIDPFKISRDLWKEAQSLVGKKYDEASVNAVVRKLRRDLMWQYEIIVNNTVQSGENPAYVHIVFRVEQRNPKPDVDLNECIVESVGFEGVEESEIPRDLLEEAEKFVGRKYDDAAANELAQKLRRSLKHGYEISINNNLSEGKQTAYVKVVFRAEKPQQKTEVNINERYTVESIEFSGIDASKISKDLREEAEKFIGHKYSARAANEFTKKLHEELKDRYWIKWVEVKVNKGEKPDHIKLEFKFHKESLVGFNLPLAMYHSKQGFSGALELELRANRTRFLFGIISDADTLLERNAGFYLSFQQKSLGTDALGLRIDFDSFHQGFNNATITGLEQRPDVPYFYRARQNFAPSLSVRPMKNLTVDIGLSFQRLDLQYPVRHTETAYAGTGDILYSRKLLFSKGFTQTLEASYGLRTATRVLDSDYVYTRHLWTADYELSKGKSTVIADFSGGIIGGAAPLFERFSVGNSETLRGWNKFDVAPVGGSRMAHGTLEYHYGSLAVFYDVGTVWDPEQYNPVRHGIGFGLVFGGKNFISLAFPVRTHRVSPIFMIGCRF